MAFGFIKDIFTGGVGDVIKNVSDVVDKFVMTRDEKEALKMALTAELNRHDEVLEAEITTRVQMEFNDLANARDMQIAALKQDDRFPKRYLYYLASFIVLSAVAFGIFIIYVPIPPDNLDMVELFAHVFMFTGAVMVLQFFFGSSAGSLKKTDIIGDQLSKMEDKKAGEVVSTDNKKPVKIGPPQEENDH